MQSSKKRIRDIQTPGRNLIEKSTKKNRRLSESNTINSSSKSIKSFEIDEFNENPHIWIREETDHRLIRDKEWFKEYEANIAKESATINNSSKVRGREEIGTTSNLTISTTKVITKVDDLNNRLKAKGDENRRLTSDREANSQYESLVSLSSINSSPRISRNTNMTVKNQKTKTLSIPKSNVSNAVLSEYGIGDDLSFSEQNKGSISDEDDDLTWFIVFLILLLLFLLFVYFFGPMILSIIWRIVVIVFTFSRSFVKYVTDSLVISLSIPIQSFNLIKSSTNNILLSSKSLIDSIITQLKDKIFSLIEFVINFINSLLTSTSSQITMKSTKLKDFTTTLSVNVNPLKSKSFSSILLIPLVSSSKTIIFQFMSLGKNMFSIIVIHPFQFVFKIYKLLIQFPFKVISFTLHSIIKMITLCNDIIQLSFHKSIDVINYLSTWSLNIMNQSLNGSQSLISLLNQLNPLKSFDFSRYSSPSHKKIPSKLIFTKGSQSSIISLKHIQDIQQIVNSIHQSIISTFLKSLNFNLKDKIQYVKREIRCIMNKHIQLVLTSIHSKWKTITSSNNSLATSHTMKAFPKKISEVVKIVNTNTTSPSKPFTSYVNYNVIGNYSKDSPNPTLTLTKKPISYQISSSYLPLVNYSKSWQDIKPYTSLSSFSLIPSNATLLIFSEKIQNQTNLYKDYLQAIEYQLVTAKSEMSSWISTILLLSKPSNQLPIVIQHEVKKKTSQTSLNSLLSSLWDSIPFPNIYQLFTRNDNIQTVLMRRIDDINTIVVNMENSNHLYMTIHWIILIISIISLYILLSICIVLERLQAMGSAQSGSENESFNYSMYNHTAQFNELNPLQSEEHPINEWSPIKSDILKNEDGNNLDTSTDLDDMNLNIESSSPTTTNALSTKNPMYSTSLSAKNNPLDQGGRNPTVASKDVDSNAKSPQVSTNSSNTVVSTQKSSTKAVVSPSKGSSTPSKVEESSDSRWYSIKPDKHPQPSGDGPFGSPPTVLKAHYGDETSNSPSKSTVNSPNTSTQTKTPIISPEKEVDNNLNYFPRGFQILKLTRSNVFKDRLLLLSGDHKRLFWREIPKDKTKPIIYPNVEESIKLSDVTAILTNGDTNFPTVNVKKSTLKPSDFNTCVSFVLADRTVDLKCYSPEELTEFLKTIRKLIKP